MDIYPAADARSARPGTVFHYKICRCITLPDGRSIHGLLPLSEGDNGERRSQARTVICLLYHFYPSFL